MVLRVNSDASRRRLFRALASLASISPVEQTVRMQGTDTGLARHTLRIRGRELARLVYHSRLTPGWVRELRRRVRARRLLLADIDLPPTSYSQKVRYRMATDRRTILATFADRVAAREYVRARAGDSVLTQVYAVTEAPE